MKTFLVTGGAGFIGSNLISQLLKLNNIVYTIDNLSTGLKSNIPKGAKFIRGDCAEKKTYDRIRKIRFDVIFHIAGQSSGEISFEDPIYDLKSNLESTILLLEFAKQNNCRRFIYASSMSVYGVKEDKPIMETAFCNPISFYGIGKLSSEQYMKIYHEYGIKCTSLRFFNVYGPGQNLKNTKQGMISIYIAQMIDNKKIIVKGSGDRFRDFIHINDVITALLKSYRYKQNKFEIINIGSGTKTTVKYVISCIVDNYDPLTKVLYKGKTQGDINGIYSDNSKMIKLLKFIPKTPLNLGIKNMIIWAKNTKSQKKIN